MSQFTNFEASQNLLKHSYASQLLGREHWVVTQGFEYYIGETGSTSYVYIPQGYLTDGASAPLWISRIVPPMGSYGAAAIVHDYLCEYLTVQTATGERGITRAQGDAIFYDAMRVLGVPLWKRLVMYSAVRLHSIIATQDQKTFQPIKAALEAELRAQYHQYHRFDGTYTQGVTHE